MTKKRKKYAMSKDKIMGKPTPLPPINFDIGKMVRNYHLAKAVQGMCEQNKLARLMEFHRGIVAGYDDWFRIMGFDQDKFDMVAAQLDKKKILQEAKEYMNIIAGMTPGGIWLPGQGVSPEQIMAEKTHWDNVVRSRK